MSDDARVFVVATTEGDPFVFEHARGASYPPAGIAPEFFQNLCARGDQALFEWAAKHWNALIQYVNNWVDQDESPEEEA
jgi:hypothetical protein